MGTRTIKSGADAAAGVVVSSNASRMHGNKDNYIMTDERGTTINGPVSFVSGSDQIRVGGLWTMNHQLLLSLPSTMATPNPVFSINPPVKQLTSIMKEATVMIALLGAFGALS
jgi:hypothetical protein